MLWRRSSQAPSIPPSASVPDAEVLRRAALQASWRRDRWVARRRVLLRWVLWATGRYLMPCMLVFGLGTWLWLVVVPHMSGSLNRQTAINKQPAASPATDTPPLAVAVPVPVVTPCAQPHAPTEDSTARHADPAQVPECEELPTPLRLRLDPQWVVSTQRGNTTALTPAAADNTLDTIPSHLKLETWLHSKEP